MTSTWKCDLCGYVHSGSQPPEHCPVCGAEKNHFSPLVIERHRKPSSAKAWQCSICDYIATNNMPPDSCPVCGAAAALFHPHQETTAVMRSCDIKNLVIVGAGIAGLTAAEEARKQSAEVGITLISKEDLPYYRLNLTRLLAGEVDEDELSLHDQDWFKQQKISFTRLEALSVDRENKEIRMRDGQTISYDRMILTNGAHPFVPPIPGANRQGVMTLRTIEHARKIIKTLYSGCRVVCIGGGLLGLETARALQKRGADVTVIEGFDWLLPRQLPESAAALLKSHLEKQGMKIHCGVQVKELAGDESVRSVVLEDGCELSAEMVIFTTGVRPNSHLARECGLKVQHGVIVDDRLFTSDSDILAAGDVAEHQGRLYGIWPASYAQGVVAGINSVGGNAEFREIPMTSRIKVLDIDLFSIGNIRANDASTRLYEVQEKGQYRGLVCHDGQVVGAVLYGDITLMRPMKEAVEQGQRIQELGILTRHFPELN